jgi:hypothetical protein
MSGGKHLLITWPTSQPQPFLQAALFASALQPSDALTPDLVTEAVSQTICELGRSGCEGAMAQEFGDHPQAAAERMRWIHRLCDRTPAQALAAG